MKHSQINIANVTQVLSKVMDCVNQAAFLQMYSVIKYAPNIRCLGLKLEPKGSEKEPWKIVYFSNSDYAGDLVTRRSVSGFVLNVPCVLESW